MTPEPIWLTRAFLDAAHADQLKQHGGLPGIRDANALESAVARPKTRWSYEPETTIFELAAAYGYAIATSHPYADGNKRAAFIAMYTFLGLNDLEISASAWEVVDTVVRLAEGALSESELSVWLQANTMAMEIDQGL